MLYPHFLQCAGGLGYKDGSTELETLAFPCYAGESPELRVLGSHRGGVEDDLRVITVVSRYHISRESGKSRGGRWLGHHGDLLGLEQEPGGQRRACHEKPLLSPAPAFPPQHRVTHFCPG